MDPRPNPRPWPPVVPWSPQTPPSGPPRLPTFTWQRLTRTRRGAAGLAIGSAALLLWPFSGWSWIPWLIGLGLLVVLRLLRLDGLFRGWIWHLGGLAVLVGLMYSTTPWAWALAASIGVLIAGLLQLPWWRLAAVGVVLCAISGTGFALTTVQTQQQQAAADTQVQHELQAQQGAPRPQGVLPIVLNRIAQNVPGPICDNLLADPARAAFVAAAAATSCEAAVAALSARVADRSAYAGADAPTTATADGMTVNACALTWPDGRTAGPQLGRLEIGHKPGGASYFVMAFSSC